MDKGLIIHTIIINKGKFLLLKRSDVTPRLGGYWDIPGGTLEDGEDPSSGAVRETLEETGLHISDLRLFYYDSRVDQGKNKQFVTLIFLARIDELLDTVILNPEEHSEYRWTDFSEISNFQIVDYMVPCIDYLKNKTNLIK